MAQTILVVDDEARIVKLVRDYLERAGLNVLSARDGETALALARREQPDLIILDLMLPGADGLDVCRRLRQESGVPIIMLTARVEEADRVVGLELGADDYVTKPFSLGELTARIRALFRRANRPHDASVFQIGATTVNVSAHTVQRDGKKPETLSFYEVELLRLLFERQGQPVSREEILNKIWGLDASPSNRTIDNFVVKLRKKLEKHPNEPRHILTVYGFGYKLVP